MITVIIIAAAVFHNRRYPNCAESQSLDIIELFDKSLEIASPCRVCVGVVVVFILPAVYIIIRIAVVESRCNYEVDRILSEIASLIIAYNNMYRILL